MDFLLILMLGIGFSFTLVQATRKRLTYRMRLTSSVISITIACYLVITGVMYLAAFMGSILGESWESGIPLGVISFIGLAISYRLIKTDLRTWRWYRETASHGDD